MIINKLYILSITLLILFTSFLTFKIIDNRLKSFQKLNLIKLFVVLSSILFITLIIIIFFFDSELKNLFIVLYLLFFSFLYFTSLFYFLIVYGNIKPPKPDKYSLKQDNYIDFSNYLNKRVLLNDYQEVYSEENLRIYKKIVKKNKHYIIDFKTEEFTEDIYNDLYDNKMVPIMEKDLKEMQNRMYRSLYVTYIISVDRLTSYFSEFVKGLEQDRRYFSLPVGISFGGKKIYIATEIKGFEMIELKRMKKEVKMILELENKGNKT